MITIRERFQGKRKYYERAIKSNSSSEYVQTVEFRLIKVEKNGQVYFVLYDDELVSISPFFKYVNFEMAHLAFSTREQTAHALRLLYCYLSLTKTDIESMKKKDIINLQYFLLGYSPSKGTYSFQLQSKRRNNTVNEYTSIYRSYFKSLGIDCDYLIDGKTTEYLTQNAIGDTVSQKVVTHMSSLREGTPVWRVPKYISVEEFAEIIKIIREDNNAEAEIIVRLMYEYGLRLGEVFGITSEDVTEKTVDGNLRPVIFLRNRFSDNKKYQSAKTLLKVNSKDVYDSPNYRQEKLGFDIIYITEDFYEMMNDFIEVTLVSAKKKIRSKKSLADSVKRQKYVPENHYIFLNSVCTTLSAKSWNEYLKTVFERAKIHIDKDVKKHNLNHRFRHGFAMFQVKYRNTNVFELKELMRHAAVSSTMVYYNPTEEDEYNMKTEFVADLYNLIPSLKEKPIFYAERTK